MHSICLRFPALSLFAFAALFSSSISRGQAPSAATSSLEETVVLNPFVVGAGGETGYAATNTLDGSRLNTALRDTPSPISVFTRDLMDDINATDMASLLRYDLSNQVEFGDADANGTGNQVGTLDSGTTWRTRGLKGGASVNGFVSSGAAGSDFYNVERASSARGPNAILFGTGSPGGVVNLRTKSADTLRDITSIEMKVGNYVTKRGTVDINKVLIKNKLALRVLGLYDNKGSSIPWVYTKKTGATVAAQYRFGAESSFRFSFEKLHTEAIGGRPWGLGDSVTSFLNALSAGTVKFDPVDGRYETANGAVVGASSGVGNLSNRTVLAYGPNGPVLWEGTSATANRVTLSSTTSQYAGAKPVIPESIAPYGAVNPTGPSEYGENDANTLNLTLNHRLFKNAYMELTYNLAKSKPNSMIGQNPELRADLNYKLPDGTLNPYFYGNGYYFTQQAMVRVLRELRNETIRASFSYEFDAGKFGHHRFAVLGERNGDHSVRFRQTNVWLNRPYGGAPEGAANQVFRRQYFKTSAPFAEWGLPRGPERFGSDSFTSNFASIGTLTSGFVAANALDIDDDVTTDSQLVVMQNYLFNRRLVTTAGLRRDQISIYAPNTLRDASSNQWRFATAADQPSFAATGGNWFDEVELSSNRFSLGGVFHVTENFSLTANSSNGVQLAERNRSVLPNERPADPYTGESRDFGVNFSFLENKISGSVRYYNSTQRREPSNDKVQVVYVNPNNDVMSSFDYYYRQAGLTNLGSGAPIGSIDELETVYFSDADAYLTDTESKGVEFEVIANPTRNWSLRLGYSNTDSNRTNVLQEGEGWWADRLALWEKLDAFYITRTGRPSVYKQLLVDSANAITNRTVEERIGDSNAELLAARAVEQHGFGNRRHKATVWTRYGFSHGWMKGAAIGGGYRYQSSNVSGFDLASNSAYYGNPRSLFDFFLQYKTKGVFGLARNRTAMTYQLNINNVLNDDTIIISKSLTDTATGAVYNRRAFREEPRTLTLSVRLDL